MLSLGFLQKIGEVLQKSLSSEETYSAVFDILEGVVAFDSATLFVADPASGVLEVVESRGSRVVDLVPDVAFSRGEGLSGWVASQRKPVILPAMSGETSPHRFKSFVSIPLWSGDTLEGVLNLGHVEPGYYKQKDNKAFEQLGTQLSLIIEQLRLRSELHQKNRLLETTLHELQTAQSALVERERLAAIGELVTKVNHEINNPLSIIISFIDLMVTKYGEEMPEAGETLAKMKEAAYRIKELTAKLEQLQSTDAEEYMEGVKMLKLS